MTSNSSTRVKCGMRRFASCMFSAILRRRPTTLIVSSGARRRAAGGDAAAVVEQVSVEVGVADAVAGGLHLGEVDAEVAGAGADGGGGEDLAPCQSSASSRVPRFDLGLRRAGGLRLRIDRHGRHRFFLRLGRRFGAVGQRLLLFAVARRFSAASAPSVSITASTEPIGIWSPTSPASLITLPATGLSISTVALSVIMSASCWSSSTCVADLDVPGDDLRLGDAFADVGQLEFVGRHQSAITFSSAFFIRFGPGK